jgi:hypothetical protein
MPKLRVYSNKLKDEHESNDIAVGESFAGYLQKNVRDYSAGHEAESQFSVALNGVLLPPAEWNTPLKENDVLDVVLEPKGTVAIVAVVLAVITTVASIRAMNALDIPDNYNSTTPDSSSIYSVNAQGNKPKLMGPWPELFGFHKTYPDLIASPWRKFVAHEEWKYILLAVTNGECQLTTADIYIGDTPVSELGSDIDIAIFAPGDFVGSHPAHAHMYNVAEVAGGGVELLGKIPDYDFTYTSGVGDTVYLWEVQANPKQLMMASYFVSEPGVASRMFDENWAEDYYATYDTALEGLVVYLTGYAGYYRVTKGGAIPTFQRVDPVTFEYDTSWTGFGTEGDIAQGYWNTVLDADYGEYAGWFNAVPEGQQTDAISFDFQFPEGLTALDANNTPQERSVTIEIDYRTGAGGAITTETETFTEATLNERGYTITKYVPLGEYQVRCRVTTYAANDLKIKDRCMWTGLRSEFYGVYTYPGTVIAMAIKGTHRLSGIASQKVNCRPTRKLPVLQYSGGVYSWTAPQITRSVSAAAGYVCKQGGNTDEQIDLAELYRIGQILDGRGDYFDGIFDSDTTTWEALKRILAVGFAQPIIDHGQIVPVRDDLRTDLGTQFSEANLKKGTGFKEKTILPGEASDKYDGCEVEYTDPDTWKSATVKCLLPGQGGVNLEKVRMYGDIDRTRAYQFGMRRLAARRYRNRTIEFTTEMDALGQRYLDPIQIGWTMPHRSQTGYVREVIGNVLRLSEPVAFTTGENHTVIVSEPDGTANGPYVATAGDDDYHIVLDTPLSFSPDFSGKIEPPKYQFGPDGKRSLSMLLDKMTPNGMDSANVVCVINDPRVYDYDDATPPVDA